jgi:hypothetical protein
MSRAFVRGAERLFSQGSSRHPAARIGGSSRAMPRQPFAHARSTSWPIQRDPAPPQEQRTRHSLLRSITGLGQRQRRGLRRDHAPSRHEQTGRGSEAPGGRPTCSLLGTDDILEIGNHHVDGLHSYQMCVGPKLCITACEAARAKRDVEFAVVTDQIPDRRGTQRSPIVIKRQSFWESVCANTRSELLQRGRESFKVVGRRVRSDIDISCGADRSLLCDGGVCPDDDVADAVTVQHFDDGACSKRRLRHEEAGRWPATGTARRHAAC